MTDAMKVRKPESVTYRCAEPGRWAHREQAGKHDDIKHHTDKKQGPNHSPDGHAWGYTGSGPAQLAFDILADYLDDFNLAQISSGGYPTDFLLWWKSTDGRRSGYAPSTASKNLSISAEECR